MTHVRLMWDSTTPSVIPDWADMVAGYVNGRYAWQPSDWDRFKDVPHVRINVNGSPADGGDCLDVEAGDATPAQAPIWFDARKAAGTKDLAIYCNRSTLPAVEAAMGARKFYRWVATLDGTLRIPGFGLGAPAAVQFAGAKTAGLNVDLSIVWEDHWHAPAPLPPPAWIGQAATQASALAALLASKAA